MRVREALGARVAALVKNPLTTTHISQLLEWDAAGEWDVRTGAERGLTAEAVHAAALAQSAGWVHQWKARHYSGLLRLLVVCNGFEYPRNLDSALFDLVEALQAHPQLNLTLWGPGWPLFAGGVSDNVGENYVRTFGCHAFDVILFRGEAFKASACRGSAAVVVQDLEECYSPAGVGACVKTFYRHADVTMSAQASPLWEVFDLDKRVDLLDRRRLFVHNPHCSNDRLAAQSLVPWGEKQQGGNASAAASAAAAALPRYLTAASAAGATTAASSSSGAAHALASPPSITAPATLTYAPTSQPALENYSRAHSALYSALARAALCSIDAPPTGNLPRSYPLALSVGCPIATSSPPPQELLGLLSPALLSSRTGTGAGRRGALSSAYALLVAREHLMCTHRAERLLDAVEQYLEGEVGYSYPFETVVGCRRNKGFPLPHAWCAVD